MTTATSLPQMIAQAPVISDEQVRAAYSRDQSFVPPRMPDAVVYAEQVEQVQEVVRYANEHRTPVVPCSSGLNLHGGAVPREGGIVLDLSRMNRILSIDESNWNAVIEPGVTAAQFQDALQEKGLRAMLPFGVHPRRSVLTSFLERDPALAAASFEYGNELVMDTEIVLPTGELFRTGLWSTGQQPGSPMGPGRAMLSRLWSGAQGTLGILTKMNVKVEFLPQTGRIFMMQFDSFPELIEPLRMIQRREIGLECFVLNNFNLAALLCSQWQVPERFPAERVASDEFEALRERLPEWLLIVCCSGGPRLPEEKLDYEERALMDLCGMYGLRMYDAGDLREILRPALLRPWPILKKFQYRGTVHDISFKTMLHTIPRYQALIQETTNRHHYPLRDVGLYVLPVERGRACHVEIDLHADPHDAAGSASVQQLWRELSESVQDEGAFFDRPYGYWAELTYSRAGTYTQKLKQIKRELDPNNVLNPGHLCF